jgi:hypothetical protein
MPTSTIEFDKEILEKLTVHKNLDQEIVVTTVDKVQLCLMKNRDCLTAKKEWVTPLSIIIALLTTLLAAKFEDFVFKSHVWNAIYIMGLVLAFIWLTRSGYKALKNRAGGVN